MDLLNRNKVEQLREKLYKMNNIHVEGVLVRRLHIQL